MPRGEDPPVTWLALCATATGSAHLRRAEPCEDAATSLTTNAWTAVAVADGHGSARCPRAARGARFAVEAATAVLVELPAAERDGLAPALAQLPERVHRAWRHLVVADLAAAPLTARELRAVGTTGGNAGLVAYGTTVVGAAASTTSIAIAQIGDGDVLVGRTAAEHALRPLPPTGDDDPRVTDSLSQVDAADRFGVALIDLAAAPADVILVSTDGFGSAFAEPDWHDETIHQLLGAVRRLDDGALATAVQAWCNSPAQTGGDDVALGLLVARAEPPPRSTDTTTTTTMKEHR